MDDEFPVLLVGIVIGVVLTLILVGAFREPHSEFHRFDMVMQDCLNSERYTREECFQLAERLE